jgi:flagellar biosynthesis/type III secretory pathway protein FliH
MPVLTLLDGKALAVHAPGVVLQPEELESFAQSRDLVAATQAKAEQLLDDARRQIEAQARAGFEQGMQHAAVAVSRRLLEYERRYAAAQADGERQLVELVLLVLERIAPQLDCGELVKLLARNAIAETLHARRVIIRVNTRLVAVVQAELASLQLAYPWLESLEVIGEEGLGEGDCLLETPHGDVNASWSTQLEAIRATLTAGADGSADRPAARQEQPP